jgi:hypothetical protein
MKLFHGKKQNFWSWGNSLQVPDNQDFQIIERQIKGILLYIARLKIFLLLMCLLGVFSVFLSGRFQIWSHLLLG